MCQLSFQKVLQESVLRTSINSNYYEQLLYNEITPSFKSLFVSIIDNELIKTSLMSISLKSVLTD